MKTNILLTCAGPRAYLVPLFERSPEFGRLIAVDSEANVPIAHFCPDFIQTPPVGETDGYMAAILHLVEKYRVDGIATVHDVDLSLLATSPALDKVVVNGIRGKRVAQFMDKWQLIQWMAEHDFPAPPTRLSSDPGGIPASQQLVVKPRVGAGSQGIHFVDSIAAVGVRSEDWLVQQFLPGDEYHLDILCDGSGRAVSVIPKRKLRMRYGSTDLAETVRDEALLELGVRLGEAIGHTGSIDVDIMRCGGRDYILDINPRLGGGFPFTCQCAPKYMDAFLRIMRGDPVAPFVGDYRAGCQVGRMFSIFPIK